MGTLILLIPIILLLVLMNRGRQQQKRVAALQADLAPGQRVVTTAGLYARVVEVTDTTVVLEPATGVRTTWARQAVARVVEDDAVVPGPAGAPAVHGPTGTDPVETDPVGTDPAASGPVTGTTSLVKHPTDPVPRPAGATAADPDAPERTER